MYTVTLKRRIEEARYRVSEIERSEGMSPDRCPAIRSAANLGVELLAAYGVSFAGPRELRSEVLRTGSGGTVFLPGVIGDPNSERIYARIDSGFSVSDLPCSLLATLPLSLSTRAAGFSAPTVLYKSGYSGPILAPLSSIEMSRILVGDPILHLGPLTEYPVTFEEGIEETVHENFEGLLYVGWRSWVHRGSVTPEEIWSTAPSEF